MALWPLLFAISCKPSGGLQESVPQPRPIPDSSFRFVQRGSVELPSGEVLADIVASIGAEGGPIALVTSRGWGAQVASTCRVVRLSFESLPTESEEMTIHASRIEEPVLFQFRDRTHMAALVDARVMVFQAGRDNRGLRLIRPRDADSGRPVALCWLRCLVKENQEIWVACEAIGIPGGDRIYFWVLKSDAFEQSELEPCATLVFPGESRGAFADFLLDGEQHPRAVLWLLDSKSGVERSVLSAPIGPGPGASEMTCLDAEHPAVNSVKGPETPFSKIDESSGLPRCLGDSEELFVLWLSQDAATRRYRLLARTIRWIDLRVGPVLVLDEGARGIREISLCRNYDGRVLAMWTVAKARKTGRTVLAELTSESGRVLARELTIAPDSPQGGSAQLDILHLFPKSEGCFGWGVDPDSRRLVFVQLDDSSDSGR